MRILLVGFLGASVAMGQAWFPMKDRKVGGLDSDYDKRKSVDFGFARVFADEGNLRFEGKDHAGKPWRVWVARSGGIGATDVFTADFDRDGQQDLLIRSFFPVNGRCLDKGEITVVMFDEGGRPVPWHVTGQLPRAPMLPLVLDLNLDLRAEFVVLSCEYSSAREPLINGEDRGISGVYEAQHARMVPIRNAVLAPYLRIAKRMSGSRYVTWLPVEPDGWPDQMTGFDSVPSLRIGSLLKRAEECSHVINFRFENGKLVRNDCSVLGQNRILYSDRLERIGWPYAVLDGPGGRGVYIADYEDVLRRVIKAGYRVKILGDPSQPTWIWVDIN
jgi:hypothetical protein